MADIATAEPQTAAIVKPDPKAIAVGNRGLIPTNLNELWQFAGIVEGSGFGPKGMNRNGIFISIQMGLEIGLSPMQAMQCTAVINGRPSIYGDAAKALVEASGLMEDYDQWYELGGKKLTTESGKSRTPTQAEMKDTSLTCFVMSKRTGRQPLVSTFSIGDAQAAGIWGKAGPWVQYPARMLMFRARGFNLRDNFGDVLKGLRTVEEVRDDPVEVFDVTPEPTKKETLAGKLKKRAANVAANGNGHAPGEVNPLNPGAETLPDRDPTQPHDEPPDDVPNDAAAADAAERIDSAGIAALEKVAGQQGSLHSWRKTVKELYKCSPAELTPAQAADELARLEACLVNG